MIEILKRFSHYDLGVDLGSSVVKIFAEGKGILFAEPTVVSLQKKRGGKVLAVGKKAQVMIGKEPQQIRVVEPIEHGVIGDFDALLALTKHLFDLLKQTPGRWFKLIGPKVIAGVSSGATEVERRAVKAVLVKNGAREVFLVEKTMAAAIGLGLPVESSSGSLVIDLGGETTEMAVICLGGIVIGKTLSIGGKQMDEAIISYLRFRHGITIGRLTAERIKNNLGSVSPQALPSPRQLVVRGRGLESGLPKSVRIRWEEAMEAILPLGQKIVAALNEMLEETPAELTDDILKGAIHLCGGVSQIPGWKELISEETKMPVVLAFNPQEGVVRGCGKLLGEKKLLERVKLVAGLR